jgi:6-phosphogluconolactonase
MNKGERQICADRAALSASAATRVAETLTQAIELRGVAHFCLAGGSTPQGLYQLLAAEYANALDWTRVQVWFGDDRTVPPDDPDSNFRMADEALFQHIELCQDCIRRIPTEHPPTAAAEIYDALIGAHLPAGRFDLVLLGLGEDCHTASLFPGTSALHEETRYCVVNEVPQLETTRITLTYPILNAARSVLFLVAGESKAQALAAVHHESVEIEKRPAQGISPTDGELHWLVDEAAAKERRR